MNFKLKNHQIKGVKYLKKQKYVFCGDEMGLGKTLQALTAAKELNLPFLIVCPTYLKENWEAEITKFGIPRDKLLGVIGYSSLKKNENLFSKAKIIICDEAHYLKNMKAQRTQHIHRYVKTFNSKYLFLLSGTPITNRVSEFYSPLLLLSRGENNGIDIRRKFKSDYAFCNYFCHRKDIVLKVKGRRLKVPKFYGIKNKEVLKSILKGKYYRRTKDKTLDLPPIIDVEVTIESLAKDRELEEAWKEFEKTGKKDSTAKKKSAVLKAKYTAQYVEELIDQECFPVVFSDHPDAVEVMREYLGKKFNVGVINADVEPGQRQQVVSNFQAGEYSCLLATIGTANTGITLTKSNTIVFNDVSWRPADNEQATARIHRIGQERKSTRVYILRGVVDSHIKNSVEEKLRTIKEVI